MSRWIGLTIRILVGGVFIYSGWEKLMSPVQNFIAVIEGYKIIPSTLAVWVAYGFPWLELIFGTFLALGYLTRLSAAILGLFLLNFILLLSRSFILKLPITECGCFGTGIALSPSQALGMDCGLFVLSIFNFLKPSRFLSLDERLG